MDKIRSQKSKRAKKPIFAIFIHKLKDSNGKVSKKGKNVFNITAYQANGYADIRENLEVWINENTTNNKLLLFGILAFVIFVCRNEIKTLWNRALNKLGKSNSRF